MLAMPPCSNTEPLKLFYLGKSSSYQLKVESVTHELHGPGVQLLFQGLVDKAKKCSESIRWSGTLLLPYKTD